MTKRMRDIFPIQFTVDNNGDIVTDGIFTTMQNMFSNDWIFELLEIKASDMDMQYHENHSGRKLTTAIVRKLANGGALDEKSRKALAGIVYRSNYERWKRLLDTVIAEYNPIENYNMKEDMLNDTTTKEYHKKTTQTYNNLKDEIAGSENRTLSEGSKSHTYNQVKDTMSGSENRTLSDGTKQKTYNVSDNITGSENRTLSDGTKTKTYDHVKDTMSGSENRTLSDGAKTHTYNALKDELKGTETHTKVKGTVTTTKTAEITTESVQGFNSNAFQPDRKTEVTGPNGLRTETVEQDQQHPETDALSYSGRYNERTGSESDAQTTDGHDNLTFNNRYNERTGSETEEQTAAGQDNLTYVGRANTKTGTETDAQTANGSDNLTFNNRYNERTGSETDSQTTDGHDNLTYNGRYNQRTGSVSIAESNDNGQPDRENREYHLRRTGNIGVTTTQQMLEQERNIAIWDFIQTVVYPDVDRLLCLKVY